MIIDTLGFIFIFACYMVVATTIFTTLFSIPDPDEFGYFSISLRTLFDAFIGSYDYIENDRFKLSFSLFMMTHVIFL